jgi:lipoyl(octanoyl) transferase
MPAASCATCASVCRRGARRITKPVQLVNLGVVDYREALDLQRSLARRVGDGSAPDTVLFLEHPPTITLGRRTEEGEVHVPDGAEVEVVEVDRGGKSTYHAPGQLVCYPILDLTRHGQDVKKYCRDLEEALAQTLGAFGLEGTRIEGLTGIWLQSPPRKIASIGIHLSKWVSTHGYALNVDLDPAPFTDWITACGLDGTAFTSMARELGRPVSVDDVRPAAAQALADVFGVTFAELPVASIAQIRAA